VRARAAGLYQSAIEPVLHMGSVLRRDPLFARYEAAFMTYGCGFMMSATLVPLLALNRLGLSYDHFAAATIVAFQAAQLVATMPAGLTIDRVGASRTCQWAFALYAVYPLGLLLATDAAGLALATAVYGVAAAFVNMGWMLGPVRFAPSPDKVPAYIAIHTSLVGLRGIVFQFAGYGLYTLTDSFAPPLIIACVAFVWASVQMRSLERLLRERRAAEASAQASHSRPAPAPAPASATDPATEPDAAPAR
jgi:MFS family permease